MLGRIKDRTAGVPIVKLLTDAEPLVRTAAAEALQHVADDAALAALVRLLEEPAHRDTAAAVLGRLKDPGALEDRKSTRLNSSHVRISYAVFCLKKKKSNNQNACRSAVAQ